MATAMLNEDQFERSPSRNSDAAFILQTPEAKVDDPTPSKFTIGQQGEMSAKQKLLSQISMKTQDSAGLVSNFGATGGRRGTMQKRLLAKKREEEKDLQGDVEGKSFFECGYNHKHEGDEMSRKDESFNAYDRHGHHGQHQIAGCLACKAMIKDKDTFEIKKVIQEKYFQGRDDMPFHMLIHELIAQPAKNPKEKMISGCEVFFPDTLFFEKCEPKFIACNDKDFCMAMWNGNEDKKVTPGAAELIPKLHKIIL